MVTTTPKPEGQAVMITNWDLYVSCPKQACNWETISQVRPSAMIISLGK